MVSKYMLGAPAPSWSFVNVMIYFFLWLHCFSISKFGNSHICQLLLG